MLNVEPSEPIHTTIRNHFPFIWIIFNKIQIIFFSSSFVDASMRALVSFFPFFNFISYLFPGSCFPNWMPYKYIYILVCSIFVSSWFAPHSLLSLPCALCNNAPMCGHHGSFLMCCFFFSLYFTSVRVHCALFIRHWLIFFWLPGLIWSFNWCWP